MAEKITIRQKKDSEGVMVGANTEILINGEPLQGVSSATFEVKAAGLAKLTVEIYGHIEIEGELDVHRVLGKYAPILLTKRTDDERKKS